MEIFKQGNGEIKVKFGGGKKVIDFAWKKQPENCLEKREFEKPYPDLQRKVN